MLEPGCSGDGTRGLASAAQQKRVGRAATSAERQDGPQVVPKPEMTEPERALSPHDVTRRHVGRPPLDDRDSLLDVNPGRDDLLPEGALQSLSRDLRDVRVELPGVLDEVIVVEPRGIDGVEIVEDVVLAT